MKERKDSTSGLSRNRRGGHSESSRLEQIEDALHRLIKKVGKLNRERRDIKDDYDQELAALRKTRAVLADGVSALDKFNAVYGSELANMRKLNYYGSEIRGSETGPHEQLVGAVSFEEALALSNTISLELLGYLQLRGPCTVEDYLNAYDHDRDAFECMNRLVRLDMITFKDGALAIKKQGETALKAYGLID